MRTLLLITLVLTLIAMGAWFLFRPVDIARDARLLEPAQAEREVRAPEPVLIDVRRDLSETQSDGSIAPEPGASDAAVETCAERFRPGNLWVRWVGSDGGAVPAPLASLADINHVRTPHQPPDLTRGSEQLWSLAEESPFTGLWRAGRLRVRVDAMFPEPGMLEVAYDPTRMDPLELIVPPHGELVVVIEDGGLRMPAGSRCSVELQSTSQLVYWYPRNQSGTIGEELRWQYLSLNAELDLEGLVDDGRLRVSRTVVGPTSNGEVCRVVLRLGEQSPVLAAHLQDENENALSNSEVLVLCGSGSSFPEHRLRTMADGRVAWSPAFGKETPRSVRVEVLAELDGNRRVAVRELSLPESGILDLGNVRLAAPEVGFGGRVVDADGAAIEWARVQLEIVNDSEGERAPGMENELPQAFEGPDRPRSRFSIVLRTDGEGRFAWLHPRAADPQSEIVAIASAGFGSSPVRAYRGGDRDVELRVSKCGALRGRVPLAAPAGMRIALRLSTADGVLAKRPPLRKTILKENGKFRFTELPADRYQLDVVMQAWTNNLKPVTVITFDDLVVPAGGTCEDARLNPMDLSQQLTVFSFDLEGAPSDPSTTDGFFRYRDSKNAEAPWAGMRHERGTPLAWMLPQGTYDFDFDLESSRRISLRGISAGCTIQWRPPMKVRLLLDAPQIADADLEELWNSFWYYLLGDNNQGLEPKFEGRTAEMFVPWAGELLVSRNQSSFWQRGIASLDNFDIGSFKIEDSDVVQEFRLVIR